MKNHVSIEHCPEHETQVGFVYPSGSFSPDLLEEIEDYTSTLVKQKMVEAMHRLLLLLKDERNPVIALEALLLSCKANVEADGTQASIARRLRISRQRLHYQVKNLPKRFAVKVKTLHTSSLHPFNDL